MVRHSMESLLMEFTVSSLSTVVLDYCTILHYCNVIQTIMKEMIALKHYVLFFGKTVQITRESLKIAMLLSLQELPYILTERY